jgi:hypothetical protein
LFGQHKEWYCVSASAERDREVTEKFNPNFSSGMILSPLVLWPTVTPPADSQVWSIGGMIIDRRKQKCSEKNLPEQLFIQHKFHMVHPWNLFWACAAGLADHLWLNFL